MSTPGLSADRVLILAPRGRDAEIAGGILRAAKLDPVPCRGAGDLLRSIPDEADAAIVTEEAIRHADIRELARRIAAQPAWSDFPFILLTGHGGGLERNPEAARLSQALGNVSFLERPFHPTTLVSLVQSSLRGRRRQYECKRLNEELEARVEARTSELAAANLQLLAQIDELERVESTLRQMQRMEAIGQLTSGVAHDFNNLLTVVLGNIPFLKRGLAAAGIDGKMARRLDHMRIAAERGAKLADHLLSFSRRQRLEPRALDLNQTVAGMQDLLQGTMSGSVAIETRPQPDLWPALVDPTQLELTILNLAINARDAMEVGGSLVVETANVVLGAPGAPEEPPAGAYVAVCVRDTGTGMTEEVLARAFEPFFTTKEVGKGSGLGLSQVLGFAKQSGGGVRIESRLGAGTSIYVYFPRADGAAAIPEQRPSGAYRVHGAGNRLVLLVDDSEHVRRIAADMLQDLGYSILEAGNGAEALDLLELEPGIELMIADFAMPGMNGADLARLARARRPQLPVLFITGYADRSALPPLGEAEIVGKPFAQDELARKVRRILDDRRGGEVGASN